MAKKFIGIDIEDGLLRIVIAEAGKTGPVLTSATERTLPADENALVQALTESLDQVAFGDVVATFLPAVGSFSRRLEFPFSDPKKIAAALPLEMTSQVPAGEDLEFDFLAPQSQGGGTYRVSAAAARKSAAVLKAEIFQQAGVPLHVLDLSPFAFAAGLRRCIDSGVLGFINAGEITLAHLAEGQIVDFRSLPHRPGQPIDKLTSLILRDYLALAKPDNDASPPLYLIGSAVTGELQQALREAEIDVRIPELNIRGENLSAALLPAAALALRAALPERDRQLNFLKGELSPKSEWAGFRRRLIGASALLGLTLILAGAGAYTNFAHKKARAEQLREEMSQVFRETFPQTSVIVDVPAQMRSNLAQLRERARLLGLGADRSALNVLREVSARTPADITLDIRELNFTSDQLRLDGTTSSFEAINRLSLSLETSPLFRDAQITDAKMGLDGTRVDFRLNLRISPEDLLQ
ncbi:GspL/Epsl periplasmic domain-containing protein [Geoalkalibacter sp.]|uniref:GspL/Epsl periplasmic domain-containing protein n=1 Tax=Geoalkalibacter sp. TaxID=3041440 RepID=UPI00272E736F|nr:GspL/Epsl periplasmic domain-containing protein [Geoalkalibacter sp.]